MKPLSMGKNKDSKSQSKLIKKIKSTVFQMNDRQEMTNR